MLFFFKDMSGDVGMAQVVKHFLSKCEALSSNSSTAKKKKEEKNLGASIMQKGAGNVVRRPVFIKLCLWAGFPRCGTRCKSKLVKSI
jgi:2,3-bisphosphoglycerate-independent phosphoglycerate mutase